MRRCLIRLHMIDMGQYDTVNAAGANGHAVQRLYGSLNHKGHQPGCVQTGACMSPSPARYPAQLPHSTAHDRYGSVRLRECSGSRRTRRPRIARGLLGTSITVVYGAVQHTQYALIANAVPETSFIMTRAVHEMQVHLCTALG